MSPGARSVRHEELGAFLISRRRRLDSESYDLPSVRSQHRRTPGLRREDVSSIAGISTAYYTWIEQGRPFDISAEVLYAISGALRLSDIETGHIFVLAGKAHLHGKFLQRPAGNDGIMQVVSRFESGPALTLTPWLDVLGANALAQELFEFDSGANLACWFFNAKNAHVKPVSYDNIASALVALLRRNRARETDPSHFNEIIERLRAVSHDFQLLWDGHIVESLPLVDVEFDHWHHGRIAYRTILLCDPFASDECVLFMTLLLNRTVDPPATTNLSTFTPVPI